LTRRWSRLALLTTAAVLARGGGPAHGQEGSPEAGKVLTILGSGALDIGLTAADVTAAVQGRWWSRTYGGFEVVAGGVQAALFADWGLTDAARGSAPGLAVLGRF
jgi:hypothetical protein